MEKILQRQIKERWESEEDISADSKSYLIKKKQQEQQEKHAHKTVKMTSIHTWE